jgi:membrane protein implicated in regulation of membrane protease activity
MVSPGTVQRGGSAGPVGKADMPTGVSGKLSLFDRFASQADRVVSGAWFFAFCLLLVVVWLPSFVLIRDVNTWQLIINTLTTIVTFLLVALLQNTQTRSDAALQHKLNAIADGLADLMEKTAADRPRRGRAGEARELVTEPRSALNLRLVLAGAGLVACAALAVGLFWAGFAAFGWVAAALAVVAAVNVIFVQYRRVQRRRREPGRHDSLFE